MNKRAAKKTAHGIVAHLIESYLEVEQPYADMCCAAGNLMDGPHCCTKCRDAERVAAALGELVLFHDGKKTS